MASSFSVGDVIGLNPDGLKGATCWTATVLEIKEMEYPGDNIIHLYYVSEGEALEFQTNELTLRDFLNRFHKSAFHSKARDDK